MRIGKNGQPHTDAAPSAFFPHTPLLFPHPIVADPGSLAPAEGFEAEDGVRSLPLLAVRDFSLMFSPKPKGDGTGGVERLFMLGADPGPTASRVPIGATAGTPGPAEPLVCRGGEPPGDEVEVRLDCWAVVSKRLKPWLCAFDAGDEVLLARERCCCELGEGPPVVTCCV